MRKPITKSIFSAVVVFILAITPAVLFAQEAEKVIDAAEYKDMESPDCGLQAAIDAAANMGGATVVIPEGEFPLRRGLVIKDRVVLKGAGMDATILTPVRRNIRMDIVKDSPDADGWYHVNEIPEDMEPGAGIILWSSFPVRHFGYNRPGWVTEIDRENNALKAQTPYGAPGLTAARNSIITFGDVAALDKDIKKGDAEIHLKSAGIFQAGDELAIGEPGNDSRNEQVFVKEVRGNTLVLESPAAKDFKAFPEDGNAWMSINYSIFALFPMIHGWDITGGEILDLTVQGYGLTPIHQSSARYTLSGIHLYNGRNIRIEHVAVRDWAGDGFSLQTGDGQKILRCEATNILGNGFHPGTGLTNTLFDENLSEGNGAGLYFCWHNRGHVMRNNQFINNRGGGITGLGNPSDRNNLIEKNLIAGNGTYGIEINDGIVSGNTIRENIIENNSRSQPGRYPGIALYAAVEDARNYTITDNIIRDTQEEPTQFVGIEEKHGERGGKKTSADENIIRKNTFAGHRTADIIVAGHKTIVEEGEGVNIVDKIEKPEEN